MSQATTTQPTNEFSPVVGGTETTSASTLLVLAYMALWVILIGFIGINWRRQRALSARLTEVERTLSARSPGH